MTESSVAEKPVSHTPPTYFTGRLYKADGETWCSFGVWAHSEDEAKERAVAKSTERFNGYDKPEIRDQRPFRWSDGRLLFAHVEHSKEEADLAADAYREDRRNRGEWSCRVIARNVRAGGADIPCFAVVVRHRWEVTR